MAKNVFQRPVNKASVADEGYEDEYYEDEYAEDVDYFGEDSEPDVTPIRSVASSGDIARIITVWPKSIEGGRVRRSIQKGILAILNMTAAPDGERRRILDFAIGVCQVRGKVNKISNDVFLMTPHQVVVEASHPEESSAQQVHYTSTSV